MIFSFHSPLISFAWWKQDGRQSAVSLQAKLYLHNLQARLDITISLFT